MTYEVKRSIKHIDIYASVHLEREPQNHSKNAIEMLKTEDCNKIIVDIRGKYRGYSRQLLAQHLCSKKAKLGKIVSKKRPRNTLSDDSSADVKL